MSLDPGTLNRRVRIEQPVASAAFNGAGLGNWALFAEVWANVQDMLPSRGEKLAEGINVAARPSRIRIRFRDDVTPSMRFVMGSRIMQIVSGPAELGFRDGLEFMVEEYRPAGNPA
ncbi:head-tail adaptor protein [Sphingobium sp. BHU LFT2]|uniref:head-tail adaptor protein n=1 Tax=Sphingobium sp. BHU LFT2 TaxID=2807634 RepID=UPI001BEA0CF1|nr:head-tail adaptor protein [Sphingobium sp. BHU LFT2]MBT2242682.1 head-tail adaptor protein [Sphingobium sp. BHU LFT2]